MSAVVAPSGERADHMRGVEVLGQIEVVGAPRGGAGDRAPEVKGAAR
jgi:hypothetical protein